MMIRLTTILRNSRETLVADTAGVLGLAVLTLGLLHLPGLI